MGASRMRLTVPRFDWEIARRGYARWAAYPAASFAGAFTNVVFGFLRTYVLLALFAQRDNVNGYSVAAAITYVWLTQGMIMTTFIWGWNELAQRIRTGDIAIDLVPPSIRCASRWTSISGARCTTLPSVGCRRWSLGRSSLRSCFPPIRSPGSPSW